MDWKSLVILAATRRQNPALKPRWSKAVAAVRLALMLGADDKDAGAKAAAVALDVRSNGALSAVAESVALELYDVETRRVGRLMSVLFFSLGAAIDAALTGNEAAAWQHFAAALEEDEIYPDRGEAWAAINGSTFPCRSPQTIWREYQYLFSEDAELRAAYAGVATAGDAEQPSAAEPATT
jgi:hypothetical protein